MARTKRLSHSNIIRLQTYLIYGEYLTLVLDVIKKTEVLVYALLHLDTSFHIRHLSNILRNYRRDIYDVEDDDSL